MTHRVDVARGRDIVARWCNLAERRLEYLTELFESGRWRRFHSERALLENIREAKAAVETWRDLLRREAALDNSAIDMSWLGRPRPMLPRAGSVFSFSTSSSTRPADFVIANSPSSIVTTPLVFWRSALSISNSVSSLRG